jgi:23S rRNA (uracil1939-C5)-methyltransferase
LSVRLTIERLGAQGDGVADGERGPVYVPFVLPGEVVNAAVERDRGTVMALLEASPLRIEPACRHFTACGGCALQHLEQAAYREFKRQRVVEPLRQAGISAEVAPLVSCPPGSRRRVVLAARRTERGMLLGFHRPMSPEIVDIQECPVSLPSIVGALDDLRAVARLAGNTPRAFRMTVTATASGLDVALAESGRLDDGTRRNLSDLAIRLGLARLSIDGEIVVEPKKPVLMAGDVAVSPPAGAFLQAVESAEDAMAGLALAHLGKARRVADLFAGSGAFTFRLARHAEVHAVEGDAAALSALDRAFRHSAGLKKVTGERRDLFRRPLLPRELDRFDGVVFDPPRSGAEEQATQLARSTVPRVVAVSCNPATLARDLSILVAGGYGIASITPIDQFLWSPHVEAVALLEKRVRRR